MQEVIESMSMSKGGTTSPSYYSGYSTGYFANRK